MFVSHLVHTSKTWSLVTENPLTRHSYYTFLWLNVIRISTDSHCDVLHLTPVRVARLVLDCNGVFAIKAYIGLYRDVWIAAIASSKTSLATLSVVM